jgi:hypothetical protein
VREAGHKVIADDLGLTGLAVIWPNRSADQDKGAWLGNTQTFSGPRKLVSRISRDHCCGIGVAGAVAELCWRGDDVKAPCAAEATRRPRMQFSLSPAAAESPRGSMAETIRPAAARP